MIFEFPDGREFDTDKIEDMERLALACRQAEHALAPMSEQLAASRALSQAILDKMPAPQSGMPMESHAEVVAAVKALQDSLEAGFRKMVAAQLADTVIRRDAITGDPERAVKVIGNR